MVTQEVSLIKQIILIRPFGLFKANHSSQSSRSSQGHNVVSEETLPKELTASHSGVSFLSNSGICSKTSMVVLVYLSHEDNPTHERLVYAMLDTQSGTTFLLEDPCQSLGINGVSVELSLSTSRAQGC